MPVGRIEEIAFGGTPQGGGSAASPSMLTLRLVPGRRLTFATTAQQEGEPTWLIVAVPPGELEDHTSHSLSD
ncbi:MAG TPA: hypothetical protein VHY82_06020, partial [Acetobacteraceae bacterium]|nr:hypothetical protein [Acetobacteraceae bacterium]